MHVLVRLLRLVTTAWIAAAATAAFAAEPGRAEQIGVRSSRPVQQAIRLQPRIVNGVSAVAAFPTVGQLSSVADGAVCTGTLIGCHTFLTAADCFDTLTPDPDDYFVFLPHAVTGQVRTIVNPAGPLFETVANTEAFETCGSGSGS
jgi:hypothetical protein